MRRIILFLVIAVAILSPGMAEEDPLNVSTWEVSPTDPISSVGHGAILDAQGKEVDRSPEFTIVAQRYYLKRLYQQADEQQRAAFRARHRRIQEVKRATQQEQILVNAALIDWLIDAVKPQDAAHLMTKNAALSNRPFPASDGKSEVAPALLERLRQEGLIKPLSGTTAGGQAYLEECRAAGVPLPPDWGSPAWKSRGMLPFKFIVKTEDAEVFAFESDSPRGTCLALPRSAGDTITALGIICLGTETSNSCFWDNAGTNASTGLKDRFDVPKGSSVPISNFFGGASLKQGNGMCTDCHAGENPFIVHPGTPLDMGAKLTPKSWYNPLVAADWLQNEGPTNVLNSIVLNPGDGSCLTCHATGRRFPEVSTALPGYCTLVLRQAFEGDKPSSTPPTMPQGAAVLGGNPKYSAHFNALQTACAREPPQRPCRVVDNGATQASPVSGNTTGGGPLCACTDPSRA